MTLCVAVQGSAKNANVLHGRLPILIPKMNQNSVISTGSGFFQGGDKKT
jgi:hypothetical protein